MPRNGRRATELLADIPGTVARIAAGRFEQQVINRVVAAINFARGLPVPATLAAPRPAPSNLATLLDEHPEIRRHLA